MQSQIDISKWLRVVLVAVYLVAAGLTARLLVSVDDRSLLPWYIALLVVFFALFSLVWLRPRARPLVLHGIFMVQVGVVVALLAFDPEFDYVTGYFALLAYQAAVVFRGRARWIWVDALIALVGVSLMIARGPLEGLGLGLTTMAIGMAMAALAVTGQEIEQASAESQQMLSRLEETNAELKRYAAEVDELAALEERNRLARDLHDSVSQVMFSILLTVRSAELMQTREPDGLEAQPEALRAQPDGPGAQPDGPGAQPDGLRAQLALLQELTKDALARMRAFIADLRPTGLSRSGD